MTGDDISSDIEIPSSTDASDVDDEDTPGQEYLVPTMAKPIGRARTSSKAASSSCSAMTGSSP